MAGKINIDNAKHDLVLGRTFEKNGKIAYHAMRYDFKPASVDMTKMSQMTVKEGNSVFVEVPHVEGSETTQYKGSKRPSQKECVLIMDHATGEFRLEKIASTIQLKKTRNEKPPPRPLTPSESMNQETTQAPVQTKSKSRPVAPPSKKPLQQKPVLPLQAQLAKDRYSVIAPSSSVINDNIISASSSDSSSSSSSESSESGSDSEEKKPQENVPAFKTDVTIDLQLSDSDSD